jgi:hypothetical protein
MATQREAGTIPSWVWWVAGVAVLLIAMAVLLPALLRDDPGVGATAGPESQVLISDITTNTEGYIGQQVTVSGAVNEMIGTQGFAVSEEGVLTEVNPLLVVPAREDLVGQGFEIDQVVRVTGVVRMFDMGEVEREVGFGLNDEFRQFEGQPAIVAQEVTPVSPGSR